MEAGQLNASAIPGSRWGGNFEDWRDYMSSLARTEIYIHPYVPDSDAPFFFWVTCSSSVVYISSHSLLELSRFAASI